MSLLDRIDVASLHAAWKHVEAADAEDGHLAPSMKRFSLAVDKNIERLEQELRLRTFQPRPLTPVAIPKRSGGRRTLHVPSARDRVVERSVHEILSPILDTYLTPCSYAYRPGLGTLHALRDLVDLRRQGFVWVVRADIANCFSSIDRNRLLLRLEQHINDTDLLDLCAAMITRPIRSKFGLRRPAVGIPQGGSLSPLLSNVFLDMFDRALLQRGHRVIRYADDIAIAAKSQSEADAALVAAHHAANTLGLELGEEKTMTASYEQGFYFVGEELNTKYPPDGTGHAFDAPQAKTLHVGVQGAGVRISKGRIIVNRNDKVLLDAPSGHVGRLVLAGSVGFSAGARSWALANDIDVVFLSRRGSLLGSLQSSRTEAQLRRAQIQATADPDISIQLARQFIKGKIRNQRTLLRRLIDSQNAETVAPAADELDRFDSLVCEADNLAELRGVEGIAARRYFEAIRALLPKDCGFKTRARRPPPDLVNSALGYAYAVLLGETNAACAAAGLDPTFGFLHEDHHKRPSLALDLMEEYRPLVVDQVVVELVRRRSLTTDQLRNDQYSKGVLLSEKGRRRLLAALEDRLLTIALHLPSRTRVSYRRSIQIQAMSITRSIRNQRIDYEPVRWR